MLPVRLHPLFTEIRSFRDRDEQCVHPHGGHGCLSDMGCQAPSPKAPVAGDAAASAPGSSPRGHVWLCRWQAARTSWLLVSAGTGTARRRRPAGHLRRKGRQTPQEPFAWTEGGEGGPGHGQEGGRRGRTRRCPGRADIGSGLLAPLPAALGG